MSDERTPGRAPQNVRDDVIHGESTAAGTQSPMTHAPRVTPSSTRGGWSAGGMAIPALLVVVVLLALSMLVLR